MSIYGQCDCCEKQGFLSRIMSPSCGETYACKECCGIDPREYDEDEDQHVLMAESARVAKD
jgi:hypothetical protein